MHHQHPCAPFARPCPPQPRCPRTAYLVRAEGEGEQLRGISFKSNKNAVRHGIAFRSHPGSSNTGLMVAVGWPAWQNLGYTEDDSAGQSNIFAVEVRKPALAKCASVPGKALNRSTAVWPEQPKQYVGNRDGSSPSLTLPIIAAVVATGAIGLGLFAVRGSGPGWSPLLVVTRSYKCKRAAVCARCVLLL